MSSDEENKEATEEITQDLISYLSRQPIGYHGINAPSGSIIPYIQKKFWKLNKKYDGRGFIYLGRAIENLLNSQTIRFFEGNYVLEKQV